MPRWLPRMFRWCALVCLLSAPAGAQEADSVTRDAARSLGLSGVEAYQAGEFEVASDRLEKAYALINVPSLGLWSARALAKRNLLVEAAKRYYDVVGLQVPQGDAAVQSQAQVDAQTELEALRPQIPRLVIRVNGADASNITLSIDGQATPASVIGKPRLVNPGPHRVEGQLLTTKKGASVDASVGQEASIVLDFSAASTNASAASTNASATPGPSDTQHTQHTRRTLGWIGVGRGWCRHSPRLDDGVLALNKRASLQNSGVCVGSRCPPEKQDAIDGLNTFRTVSSIGLIAGGALAATGIVLLLTTPSNEQQLAATISGESVTLRGRF